MRISIIVAVAAVLAGLLRRGSLENLARTHFSGLFALFLGLGIQVAFDILWRPSWMTRNLGLVLLIGSNLLVGYFVFANRRLPGMVLAGVGLLLNFIVITANGAMPISEDAAIAAGADQYLGTTGIKYELMGNGTLFPWLADVIPIPGIGIVVSVGDIVLAAGIAQLIYCRMTSEQIRPATSTSD